jgi:hypothetical protein
MLHSFALWLFFLGKLLIWTVMFSTRIGQNWISFFFMRKFRRRERCWKNAVWAQLFFLFFVEDSWAVDGIVDVSRNTGEGVVRIKIMHTLILVSPTNLALSASQSYYGLRAYWDQVLDVVRVEHVVIEIALKSHQILFVEPRRITLLRRRKGKPVKDRLEELWLVLTCLRFLVNRSLF